VESPVPKSAVRALNAVELMTVPVTTGWPAVLMLKTPEPLKDIAILLIADYFAAVIT